MYVQHLITEQSVTDLLVTGFNTTRTSTNIVHRILGRLEPDVTLGPASLRSGTVEYLCKTSDQAEALEALHAPTGTLALAHDDTTVFLIYVVANTVDVRPEIGTDAWIVSVSFQEVAL